MPQNSSSRNSLYLEENLCKSFLQLYKNKHMIHIRFVYQGFFMGIVKIDDDLHEEIRKASSVMVRSINAQAEYWMKIGMLAESNPNMSYNQIINEQMRQADINVGNLIDG